MIAQLRELAPIRRIARRGPPGDVALHRHRFQDPVAFLVIETLVVAALLSVVAQTSAAEIGQVSLSSVAVWASLCALANILPVPSAPNVYLSMSSPANIAIAVLFSPGIAGALVASSSISEWEVRRQTTLLHAFYNRAQLGVSAAAAAATVRAFGADVTIAGAAGAVVAYHGCNSLLVMAAEITCRGTPLKKASRGLLPPGSVALLSYLSLGLMGVALAATYREVGWWAVGLLMLPMLGARYAVATSVKLERAQRAQRMLANRLIDERERERIRIAGEIHDVVLQDLAGVHLMSSNVQSAIAVGDGSLAADVAQQLERAARNAVTSLRAAITNLRRAAVDEAGIVATLARYARTFSAQFGIAVEFATDRVTTLPPSVGLLVYESCQEALRNVSRHASAQHVHVSLRRVTTNVELRVRDDGTGIDETRRSAPPGHAPSGVGLRLLQDKVELLGGTLTINSTHGCGTEVIITIPLEDDSDIEVEEP